MSGPRAPRALDAEAVELANAYGPYTHGTWAGNNITVGDEEALAGREAFMASLIRRSNLQRFTQKQLSSMTLVDVGCYDGWLVCQLADLPFAHLIGGGTPDVPGCPGLWRRSGRGGP